MNLSTKVGIVLVLFAAAFYQGILKTTLFITLGIGRDIQPISDFPDYKCRRIHDPRLQACEDMWLSEETRQLFLACSSSLARSQWMPNIGRFNASGRSLEDAIIALDIDKPTGSSFSYSVLTTPDFSGVNGDGRLHLVGFTGRTTPASSDGSTPLTTELHLVNARPSIDTLTGAILDNSKVGPNMTIESFSLAQNSKQLKHIQTWSNEIIKTPNNIALDPTHGLWFTNDHGDATHGLAHQLAPFTANGNIAYCGTPTSCRIVTENLKFPNGLHLDPRGAPRLYVPSAWIGGIRVYKSGIDRRLEQVSYIDIDLPIDNLSQDSNGDIWAAAMPRALDTLKAMSDPLGIVAPSTVFRIRRGLNGWEVEKVLEDRDAEVLPGATTVIHDVKTGRIFLSGVTSPFISVCEKVKMKGK